MRQADQNRPEEDKNSRLFNSYLNSLLLPLSI